MISFASDNNSGVHPAVLRALTKANEGHCPAYGDDPLTRRVEDRFRELFGPETRTYFVFLGTAANVLSIQASLKPFEAVLCSDTAHIHTDECGALEATGRKLYSVPCTDGKIRPGDCRWFLTFGNSVHHSRPRMISITQSTELGGVYSREEIRNLADFCHAHGFLLHMDGARIANAAVSLGCDLRETTVDLGVDVLSFGGTKNGLMYGEAVLVFRDGIAEDLASFRKRAMQLGSKMRYIAAQFDAYLSNDLWRTNATQANAMARLLADSLRGTEGLEITRPVEANVVFARLPRTAALALQKKYHFYLWNEQQENRPEARWMTAFDSTPEMVGAFSAEVRAALA